MGAFDGDTLADRFRNHFGHTDHLYGALLAEMADDWEVGGVTREIFDGWEDAPARQFPQLRMLAGLFRIVLRGDAPQLEGFYPALGGDLDHHEAWAVVRPVLGAHAEELHESLREAPQTNEPARTAALLVGLAEAVRRTGLRRVRLLEPGASAGPRPARRPLPLRRRRLGGRTRRTRPWSSRGAAPRVRARAGRGRRPAGLRRRPGRRGHRRGRRLPDLVRLALAARPARPAGRRPAGRARAPRGGRPGARVDLGRRSACAEPVADGVLTVVWHSVTRLYWPAEETAAMTAAVDEARARIPVVHVAMEHDWPAAARGDDPGLPLLTVDDDVVATCDHHGPPIRLLR